MDVTDHVEAARRSAALVNLDMGSEERMHAAIDAGRHLRALADLGDHPKAVEDLIAVVLGHAPKDGTRCEFLRKAARAVESEAIDAHAAAVAA